MPTTTFPLSRQALSSAALSLALLGAGGGAACGRGDQPTLDVQGPTRTTDTTGPYEVTVVVRDEAPITSARVRWFTLESSQTPAPVALERQGGTERWVAKLPGQPTGTTIRYRVEVEDDEGRLLVAPAQGKADEAPKAFEFSVVSSDAQPAP